MNEITKELLEALKLAGSIIGHPDDSASKHIAYVIAKSEAALAEPQADADGWIPWSGGECPLGRVTQVDVRFRNGDEFMGAESPWPAGSYSWSHDESDYDIVAYRIAKESGK